MTAKASRPDAYRAANELLRMALDGRLVLSMKPRGYFENETKWLDDAEAKRLNEIVYQVKDICKKNAMAYVYDDSGRKVNKRYQNKDDEEDDDADDEEEEEYGSEPDLAGSENESKDAAISQKSKVNNKFALLQVGDDNDENVGDD